jgi:hypothetical protein
MTEARTVEKLALIGSCFSDSEFQSLAPYYGVDENENETSDDSVLTPSLNQPDYWVLSPIIGFCKPDNRTQNILTWRPIQNFLKIGLTIT